MSKTTTTKVDSQDVPRRRRRAVIVIAATAAVVAGAGFGVNAYLNERAADAAVAEATELAAQVESVKAALVEQITAAEKMLTDTNGQVANPATRDALAEQITAAKAATDLTVTVPDDSMDRATAEALRDQVAAVLADVRDEASPLKADQASVSASHSVWMLDQAKTQAQEAADALAATLAAVNTEQAEQVLAGSENKVADNTVRQTLRDAIDNLNTTVGHAQGLGAVEESTVAGYEAAAKARTDAKTAIETAQGQVSEAQAKVTEAQETWEAEQARIAAEKAAKEKAARDAAAKAAAEKAAASKKSTSSGSTGTTKSGSSKNSGSGSTTGSTGSGGSTNPAPEAPAFTGKDYTKRNSSFDGGPGNGEITGFSD